MKGNHLRRPSLPRRLRDSLSQANPSTRSLPEGGWWPRADQRELLRAVLLDAPSASEALRRWRNDVDLDDIDVGSFGLLPLLAERLSELGSDHADDSRILGVRRQVWAKNQLHLSTAEAAVSALSDVGIPAMVLKGLPMVLGVYEQASARLMADVDILVPFDLRHAAIDALTALGWVHPNPLPVSPMFRAAVFDAPGGSSVDLQWRLLQQPDLDWYDDECWDRARQLVVRGATARWPSAADLLFHLLVHGAKANPVPPLRWVTDATAVIRSGLSPADWDLLVDIAERCDLSLPVGHGLQYLVDLAEVPVPAEVRDALQRHRPAVLRRVEHRLAALPVPVRHRTHAVTSYLGEVRRLSGTPTPMGFIRFAKQATGAASVPSLVKRGLSRDAIRGRDHG